MQQRSVGVGEPPRRRVQHEPGVASAATVACRRRGAKEVGGGGGATAPAAGATLLSPDAAEADVATLTSKETNSTDATRRPHRCPRMAAAATTVTTNSAERATDTARSKGGTRWGVGGQGGETLGRRGAAASHGRDGGSPQRQATEHAGSAGWEAGVTRLGRHRFPAPKMAAGSP